MELKRCTTIPFWWATLETMTMRLGVDFFRRSNRQFVRRKWPRWFTPNCISNPSAVFHCGQLMTPASQTYKMLNTSSNRCRCTRYCKVSFTSLPALLMSISSLSSVARMSLARCLTDCRDARSNCLTITFPFPLLFLTSSAAVWARSMSLHAIMTLAPDMQISLSQYLSLFAG